MDSDERLTWAETVQAILTRTGWTYEIMAEKVGVTQGMISKWKHGRNQPGGPAQILILELYGEFCNSRDPGGAVDRCG